MNTRYALLLAHDPLTTWLMPDRQCNAVQAMDELLALPRELGDVSAAALDVWEQKWLSPESRRRLSLQCNRVVAIRGRRR